MKKLLVLFLLFLLWSCESSDNKISRLTIDKYSRKLSSMFENVVNSRNEEGSQSKMTLNDFYIRYTSLVESFINDLNFETISPKYSLYRNELLSNAKSLKFYLDCRKSAVGDLSDTFSAYESGDRDAKNYHEYESEMMTSEYSSSMYSKMALNSLQEFRDDLMKFYSNKYSFINNLHLMDSVCSKLDTAFIKYNLMKEKENLQEKLIMPVNLKDTINDWVQNGNITIKDISFPKIN